MYEIPVQNIITRTVGDGGQEASSDIPGAYIVPGTYIVKVADGDRLFFTKVDAILVAKKLVSPAFSARGKLSISFVFSRLTVGVLPPNFSIFLMLVGFVGVDGSNFPTLSLLSGFSMFLILAGCIFSEFCVIINPLDVNNNTNNNN